jgi:hypothetical protein
MARTCVRRSARRRQRPARLQPRSHRSRRRASRDGEMDRRGCLSFRDRERLQSGGRMWARPVPATDHPRRWDVRRRWDLPRRGWTDRHRAGASRALFRIDRWFPIDADRRSHRRIAAASLLFDDASEQRRVPHSLRVNARGQAPAAPRAGEPRCLLRSKFQVLSSVAKRWSPDDGGANLIEQMLGRFARVLGRKVRGQFNDPAVAG